LLEGCQSELETAIDWNDGWICCSGGAVAPDSWPETVNTVPGTGYPDIKFTKHAIERMQLRVISEEMVAKAIRKPDWTRLEDDGDTKFVRNVDGVKLHVVCKPLPDEGKWLVKSTWVRGEDDDGNRVDRYGRKLGKRKRAAPQSAKPLPLLNWFLVATLIVLVTLLLYYILSR